MRMLLAVSGRLEWVESVAGGGAACPKPLATAGPAGGHSLRPRATDRDDLAPGGRSQPRLTKTIITSWRHLDARPILSLRSCCCWCLRTLPLPDRLLAVIDDTPTKRYGPQVEGADIHHNPTPGPADQKYLYGHIWVTLSLAVRHPCFGALALPLRAMLYVRRKTMAKIPKWRGWTFATKLVLAARLVEWIAPIVKQAGKTLWIVVDGGYVKAPFLKRALRTGVTVIGRLRKDAALRDLPRKSRRGGRRRGRPPKYGKHRISLAKRAAHREGWDMAQCTVYGKTVAKLYKTFLATYRPTGGVIRVVIVLEDHDWFPFFSTDPNATAVEIIEAFADRATIEQDFHDVKEVWGAGQQQVRNIWRNLAVYHLNLWMHTLVELWSWNRSHDNSAIAACRPGTTPIAARRMPIAAKPYGNKSWNTNYRRLPPSAGCRTKSSSSHNA